MIIVADSGSTKTNWLDSNKQLYQTIGFNPLFHSSDFIYNELIKHEDLFRVRQGATQIFFYGASCSSPERKQIVSIALKKFFTDASVINVDHDLTEAAIATYDGRPSIACILGTGSNSCLYDGKKVQELVPALGYVLGDEGSGAYFGKKLMALYLYHELPPATETLLKGKYNLEKEDILKNVYNKPNANVYLASFAKVMTESPDKEFMDKLAEEGFTDFYKHHVACYQNYKSYPVHFVGSIAYFYKDVLKKVSEKFGCELGTIDREPVYKLLEYHLKGS